MNVLYMVVGLSKQQGYTYYSATTATQAVSYHSDTKVRGEWHYLYIFRIDFTDKDKPITIRLETE